MWHIACLVCGDGAVVVQRRGWVTVGEAQAKLFAFSGVDTSRGAKLAFIFEHSLTSYFKTRLKPRDLNLPIHSLESGRGPARDPLPPKVSCERQLELLDHRATDPLRIFLPRHRAAVSANDRIGLQSPPTSIYLQVPLSRHTREYQFAPSSWHRGHPLPPTKLPRLRSFLVQNIRASESGSSIPALDLISILRLRFHRMSHTVPQGIDADYYTVLGLRRGATDIQIKAKFRQLALLRHPDKNPDNPNATLEFQLVSIFASSRRGSPVIVAREQWHRRVLQRRGQPPPSLPLTLPPPAPNRLFNSHRPRLPSRLR